MKKMMFVLLMVLALLVWGCAANYGSGSPTEKTTAPAENTAAASGNMITISDFAFSPMELEVAAGTTVTWKNDDAASHTVVSSVFTSETLKTGDEFSFTFTDAGKYDYHCGIHPSMKGKIIVK